MSDRTPKGSRSQREKASPAKPAKPRASKAKQTAPIKNQPGSSRRVAPIPDGLQPDETHPVMPADIFAMEVEMEARVQANPNASWEERKQWTEDFCRRFGSGWGPQILSTINRMASMRGQAGVTVNNNNAASAGLESMANATQGRTAITQAAMRDQAGVTGGVGNIVESGDIRVFNEWVAKQGGRDPTQVEALKACYGELRTACPDQAESEVLMDHFRTLSAEMLKDASSRKESIIRMSRAAIAAALPTDKKFPAWELVARGGKLQ